jgi:hypothetical protein
MSTGLIYRRAGFKALQLSGTTANQIMIGEDTGGIVALIGVLVQGRNAPPRHPDLLCAVQKILRYLNSTAQRTQKENIT